MNLNEFINQYGQFVKSYKRYDNGVIRVTFDPKEKIMWLKGLFCEEMDMKVKNSSVSSGTYWFEPNN